MHLLILVIRLILELNNSDLTYCWYECLLVLNTEVNN